MLPVASLVPHGDNIWSTLGTQGNPMVKELQPRYLLVLSLPEGLCAMCSQSWHVATTDSRGGGSLGPF